MAAAPLRSVLQHLRRVLGRPKDGVVTDGELLERFAADGDQAAFELLVWRHQRMVLNVCQRVLRDPGDAEDAFQATFLVLVRRAGSIARGEALAGWLYRVAYRIALKARARTARRVGHEQPGLDLSAVAAPAESTPELVWRDLEPLLDQELSRLPEKYRVPVVLCYLEGKTYDEAAQQLDWSKGTLSTRLTRARELLRERLSRRGLALSAALFAGALAQHSASAAVPATLVDATVKAALLAAAGKALAGVVSPNVVALAESAVRTMFLSRLLTAAVLALTTGVLAMGGGAWAWRALNTPPANRNSNVAAVPAALPPLLDPDELRAAVVDDLPVDPPKAGASITGQLDAVDLAQGRIVVRTFSRLEGQSVRTFALAKGATVQRNRRDASLEDLRVGCRVTVRLSADQQSALAVATIGPTISVKLKSVDATRNTLTAVVEGARTGNQERVFPLNDDARVTIDGKDSGLDDLKEGATVLLTLSDEGSMVIQVQTPSRRTRGDKQ